MPPDAGALVGAPLPDLTLPLLDGGTLRFADLRGKRTLLYFWGSW
jgi:peroxiredoxin